jgi:hypothetical protein
MPPSINTFHYKRNKYKNVDLIPTTTYRGVMSAIKDRCITDKKSDDFDY